MISTKNLISDLSEIPTGWPFEYYLGLSEHLDGQDVKIKSIVNTTEKTPSMCVYFDVNSERYKFKDFSSGHGGDSVELVKILFTLKSRGHAAMKLMEDYNQYLLSNTSNPIKEYKVHSRYKVTDYEIRHWTTVDEKYWTKFNIGSKLLEKYNVAPLEYYKMAKEDVEGIESSITIKGISIYGYFKNDGTLYKIYQPKVSDKKFIKVKNYIQGSDQLKFDKRYLIVTSSLKDLMAFNRLKLTNTESIAPDSENTLIPESMLKNIIKKYKKIFVMFDNDEAGIRSMKMYKEKYDFDYVVLDMEKDLSDSIKKYGITKTRETLMPLFKKLI
tara:strand:- start:3340 stop:4323 length:984 start_codon:yes stop_codon:yes gene_type:complete